MVVQRRNGPRWLRELDDASVRPWKLERQFSVVSSSLPVQSIGKPVP